jgi:hypothetical protein
MNTLNKNLELREALAEVDRLTSENVKLKNRSLIDEGMDAIFHLDQINKHIDERLEELRKDIETYVDEIYDPTVIARYDELTRIKHLINKLNQ